VGGPGNSILAITFNDRLFIFPATFLLGLKRKLNLSEQRIVVIGASAGGVEALVKIARDLPRDFPAPVCVVLHIPADSPSLLSHILSRQGGMPAKEAEDGELCLPGVIYVAPPDRHLLVDREGTLSVVRGPRENRARPAVDPLFRSAAVAFSNRAIAVVLTGSLDDGTAGLIAIKERGGVAIVQDPADALYPSMPGSAVAHVDVDRVVPMSAMGSAILSAINDAPPKPRQFGSQRMEMEVQVAEMDPHAHADDDRPGHPSAYSCPDCGGVLWEIEDGDYLRYRCRVGHAYSPETMLTAQDETLEEALWAAVKTLEESARLSKRLAESERVRGNDWIVKRFEDREADARTRAELIRKFLVTGREHPRVDKTAEQPTH
jgi:two-component system chemotaxis response regulator CheB